MGCIWLLSRAHMGCIWVLSGLDLGPIWAASGYYLGPMWAASGYYLGPIWSGSGYYLGPMWAASGSYLGWIWGPYGLHLGWIWGPYGLPTWGPYRFEVQIPGGAQMGCPHWAHIAAHIGPTWAPCLCASWVCIIPTPVRCKHISHRTPPSAYFRQFYNFYLRRKKYQNGQVPILTRV